MQFLTGGRREKRQVSHHIIVTDVTHLTQNDSVPHRGYCIWLYPECTWAHMCGYGFSAWKNECIHMCEKHDYVHACVWLWVCRHAWAKCVLYCSVTALLVSVCADVCVRMYACMMEGGRMEELGLSILDQHHSDWEDPVLLSWPHM